jgi:DNA-binding NarL/FixJ family response regulator
VLIREAVLVEMLVRLFEVWWREAGDAMASYHDKTQQQPSTAGEVTEDERMILKMLGEGLKDETVAKKLGISVRTVRRKISDLERLLTEEPETPTCVTDPLKDGR